MAEKSFSTVEVARITGFSVRQLDYWDRQEMVTPTARPAEGRGTCRRYSEEDLAKLYFIRELKRRKWSTQRIHRALDQWKTVTEDPSPQKYVILGSADGTMLVLCKTKQGVRTLVDAVTPGGQLVLDIAVEQLAEEVRQLELGLD